jgi:hypothetical protein
MQEDALELLYCSWNTSRSFPEMTWDIGRGIAISKMARGSTMYGRDVANQSFFIGL